MSIRKASNELFELMGEDPIPTLEPCNGYVHGHSSWYLRQTRIELDKWLAEGKLSAEDYRLAIDGLEDL